MSSIHKNNIGLMASAGRILLLGMLTVCPPVNVSASGPGSPRNVTEDRTVLSLEDLMNISVAKRPQKVADSAAAVFVVTQEDMRRSGATSIPEALRMVPGLEGAPIHWHKWAIGSRGFNGRYYDWYPSIDITGATASDGWHALRGGFRVDSNITTNNSFTIQGDIYHDNFGETLTVPSLTSPTFWNTYPNNGYNSGGDLLGRWNHSFARSSTSLQMYCDRTNIADPTVFGDHESVYDIDFQHDIHLGENQELVWGLGYRSIQDSNGSSFTVALLPDHRNLNQYSAFLQDEVSLLDNRIHITVGSKF